MGSNLVTEHPIKFGAYLSARKEMTYSGFEPAPNLPGRTLYTLGYCPYMHLHLYAFILSLTFTFALQHPPPLNKEERERASRSGGSVRS